MDKCQKRFKVLRDGYFKEKKDKITKSGSAAKSTPARMAVYKSLSFLDSYYKPRR
jgi:hypothetical protein